MGRERDHFILAGVLIDLSADTSPRYTSNQMLLQPVGIYLCFESSGGAYIVLEQGT